MPNSCITITKVHNRTLNYQHMTEHTKSNFQHLHTKDSKLAFWTCHGAGFVVLFVQVHRVFMCIAKKTKKIGPPFHVWDMKTYLNGWNLWQIHVESHSAHLGIMMCHFQLVSSKVEKQPTAPGSDSHLPKTTTCYLASFMQTRHGSTWQGEPGLRFPMSNESDIFSKRF